MTAPLSSRLKKPRWPAYSPSVTMYSSRGSRPTSNGAMSGGGSLSAARISGLEGLNMRALGQRLGSSATAVYWLVGSKENLIALAADQVWNEIGRPDPAAVGWRAAAATMATDLHAMLTRHSWLVQAFGSQVLYGPGKASHDDHGLAVYEAAGFTSAQVGRAAVTVFTFVLGHALGAAAAAALTRKLSRDGADGSDQLSARMAEAREIAARFPRLRARLGRLRRGPRRQFRVRPAGRPRRPGGPAHRPLRFRHARRASVPDFRRRVARGGSCPCGRMQQGPLHV